MQNIMDLEKMNQCIKKLEMYVYNEKININNIDECLKKTSSYYQSDNQNKVEAICFQLYTKLLTIKKNHIADIQLLNTNLNNYTETSTTNANIFTKLEEY